MKNIFRTLAAVAIIAFAAACSKDGAEALAPKGENTTVSFDVQLPGGIASRTTNDGKTAKNLFYAVFEAGSVNNTDGAHIFSGNQGIDLSTTVSLDLVSDQTYDIVFWAQAASVAAPNLSTKEIAMAYAAEVAGSDESRDAFIGFVDNLKVEGAINGQTVYLKRPFAQLNIALSQGQIAAAKKAGFELATVTVKAQTHNNFDFAAGNGNADDQLMEVTFKAADYTKLDPKTITVNGTTYDWVSFNYLLPYTASAAQPTELINVEVIFTDASGKTIEVPAFANVPIERNHRTNIVGDLLTDPANFNVVILPGFDNEDHVVDAWDGQTTKAPEKDEDGNYIIDEASELAWIAEQVNGVSRAATQTFKGETFLLTKDIDLAGQPWMPIGPNADASNKFQGTLDGQNHIVMNLNVNTPEGYTAAGLFGALNGTVKNLKIENATIKHISTSDNGLTDNGIAVVAGSLYNAGHVTNVHVKNAKVEGNRYMGGIVGYTYGNVKDCSVENLELIATPNEFKGGYDNGDKVGGIVGAFWSESVYVVSGNTAKNVTINGYRDLGGIAGSATAAAVKNNKLEGTITITADQLTNSYGPKDVNAAAIVGRCTSGEVDSSNVNNAEVTITVKKIDGVDIVNGEYLITNKNGLVWFANEVNQYSNYEYPFKDEVVKLANDIDLEGMEWTPIGNYRFSANRFCGTFDGQNKTISNFKITKKTDLNDAGKSSYGFFGNLEGTVKNLTITGVSISGAPKFIGVLAGRFLSGLVENCHVKNSQVTCDNWTIGGVIGQWNDGKISGCSIEGSTITGYGAVGAIAGIVLNAGERTVENCTVKNCKLVQNGSFGGDYDKMFGTIVGATYSGELVVNINNCKAEDNTIKGKDLNDFYGFVSEGDKVLVDGQTLVYPSTLENMVKNEGATLTLGAMEYQWPAEIADNVTIIGVEGTVFSMHKAPTVIANNITVKNVKFANEYGTALPLTASGLFENCEIVGSNGLYMGAGTQYLTGNLTFKDCTIIGEVYGINANLNGYVLTLDGCSITGWNSFGSNNSKDEKVIVNQCSFHESVDGYNKLRFYQASEVTNCTFEPSASIDFDHPYQGSLDGKHITISGCSIASVARGVAATKLIEIIDLSCLQTCTKTNVILDGTTLNAETIFINNANDLVAASSNKIAGKQSVVLLNDIDLIGVEFGGLFAFNPEVPNTFDGMGYTVSNWTNESGASDMGFIKQWVGPIKNVTIKNAHLKTSGRSAVLAGKVYSNIENCHVVDSSIEDSYWACGIIAGHYNSGSVKNCSVSGSSIKSNGGTGGIVGVVNETVGERGFYNCSVTNTTVNNTGAYGEGYSGALICGMINCDATVTFEGCSYENNTKEGLYVGDLYYGNPANVIVK